MMFKIGDKVLVRNDRGDGWSTNGRMDKYCGTVQEITKIIECTVNLKDCVKEDGGHWLFGIEDLTKVEEEPRQDIHITRKGNEVHAVLKTNREFTKRSVAKCHADDEFDFKTGINLALSRLFGEETKEESKKEFIPYLHGGKKYVNKFYGNIGDKTKMTLAFGEELFVGDVVDVYDMENGVKTENLIVVLSSLSNDHGVMRLIDATRNMKNGISLCGRYQFRKTRSYKDLKHGESIDWIQVILKEEE